MYNYLYN